MTQAQTATLKRCEFDVDLFDPLWRATSSTVSGKSHGIPFRASVCIPEYGARIAQFYQDIVPGNLASLCAQADIPFKLEQFGLVVAFDHATEIAIHDDAMVLDDSIRTLVARFGPVLFLNANIAGSPRTRFHRNIFPHLRFHTDRGPEMPNRYSCFTRDGDDLEQREPRKSSTLFIANIVSWLQGVREGQCDPAIERGTRMSIELFAETAMASVLGNIVLEQRWDAPVGASEIAVIDNADVLHATYHRNGNNVKGYPIGARYLS